MSPFGKSILIFVDDFVKNLSPIREDLGNNLVQGRYKTYGTKILNTISSNLFGDKGDEGRI